MENPFKYSIGSRVRDKVFLSMLRPQTGDRILDVGCGLGYFTDILAQQGANCFGIDLDQECIDYCNKHMKGTYTLGDVNRINFPDNTFNKVLCTEVLEHIDKNGVVLDEIHRVTKNGGTIVATVPCSEGMFGAFFKNIGHNHVDGNSREYHWHKGYDYLGIAKLLREHNFEIRDAKYTLVAGTEIFMGLTKIVVRMLRANKKLDSQANALEVEKTLLWKIYKPLFPIILGLARLEQPLSKHIKGHMIIMKGSCIK